MIKKIKGTVVSNKMQNTVTVKTERIFRHPFYQKVIKRHGRIMAHTKEKFDIGDMVEIEQTRPISKNKHFLVIRKLEKVS